MRSCLPGDEAAAKQPCMYALPDASPLKHKKPSMPTVFRIGANCLVGCARQTEKDHGAGMDACAMNCVTVPSTGQPQSGQPQPPPRPADPAGVGPNYRTPEPTRLFGQHPTVSELLFVLGALCSWLRSRPFHLGRAHGDGICQSETCCPYEQSG